MQLNFKITSYYTRIKYYLNKFLLFFSHITKKFIRVENHGDVEMVENLKRKVKSKIACPVLINSSDNLECRRFPTT